MKAVVAAFNQEKALVGAFSVITNLRMELFQALVLCVPCADWSPDERLREGEGPLLVGPGQGVERLLVLRRRELPAGCLRPRGSRGTVVDVGLVNLASYFDDN